MPFLYVCKNMERLKYDKKQNDIYMVSIQKD